MQIQVLGSGCNTCKKLYELTQKAVVELELEAEVQYITDVEKIIEMGIMTTPVLAINGEPLMQGFVNDIDKIKALILEAKKDICKSCDNCEECKNRQECNCNECEECKGNEQDKEHKKDCCCNCSK